MNTKSFSVAGLFLAFSITVSAQTISNMKISNTFKIGGDESSWDYLSVNPQNNLLYVSHGLRVNVLDKTTGKPVTTIEGTTGVHGFAFIPNSNIGYISCGKLDSVKVFDTTTNTITSEIATGKNPDAIFYENFSKKIIVCNGKSNDLSIIDPATNTIFKTIAVGGRPETAVSNGKDKIFVNIEDKNEIVVVNAKTFEVEKHWSLDKEEGPSGLAIDTKTNLLFSTCDKMLVVLDAESGKLIKKIPIGDGCDGVVFDEKSKMIYTSNGEGNISAIHEENANQFTKLKDIFTQKGARTIALDASTQNLYLPTAEFSTTEKDARGRAKILANSFHVLEIGAKK